VCRRCADPVLVLDNRTAAVIPADWWARNGKRAFIGNVVPFTLFGYERTRVLVESSPGIWMDTTPLMGPAGRAWPSCTEERRSRQRVAGLLLDSSTCSWYAVPGKGWLVGERDRQLFVPARRCYGVAFPTPARLRAGPTSSGLPLVYPADRAPRAHRHRASARRVVSALLDRLSASNVWQRVWRLGCARHRSRLSGVRPVSRCRPTTSAT